MLVILCDHVAHHHLFLAFEPQQFIAHVLDLKILELNYLSDFSWKTFKLTKQVACPLVSFFFRFLTIGVRHDLSKNWLAVMVARA